MKKDFALEMNQKLEIRNQKLEIRGKYNVITPKIPIKLDDHEKKILNTSNANFTTQVTSIRNVVESIMILLKQIFEKLSERIPLQLLPHLEQDLHNFAYLLNQYKKLNKNVASKKKKNEFIRNSCSL